MCGKALTLPYRRADLPSQQLELVVDNRFGNRWNQGSNKEGEEVAIRATTKDRQLLVRNLSMGNIHHLKNILKNSKKSKNEIFLRKIFSKNKKIENFFFWNSKKFLLTVVFVTVARSENIFEWFSQDHFLLWLWFIRNTLSIESIVFTIIGYCDTDFFHIIQFRLNFSFFNWCLGGALDQSNPGSF